MKLAPYPSYKPSGVEWLGDVPAHWEVTRSDPFVTTSKRQVPNEVFAGIEVMHYSIPVVQESGEGAIEDGDNIASAKQLIEERVVLVSRLNPRKATICRAVPHLDLLTLASTEFVALKPTSGSARFLEYLVSSELFRQRLDSWVQSVTRSHQRARPEQIYRFWGAWPAANEQRAIADFLDRETAKIDTLVARKRTLIERLKEKRTALISRTVTRGLPPDAATQAGIDPHPNLKPSGIEWLGDVPEHWEVKPIARCTYEIQTGPFGSQLHEADYVEGGIPLINPAHIVNGTLIPDERSSVDEITAQRLSRHQLKKGNIVMARRGEIGRCAVVTRKEDGWLCGTGALRLHLADCDSRYMVAVLGSSGFRKLLELRAVGTTMRNLSPEIVGQMIVPLPPRSEQCAIADFLDQETAKIDRMVAKVEAAIERLHEYRVALITAAVTGKVDVCRVTT